MTLLVALPDEDMLARLSPQIPDGVDLVVWRAGDKALDRMIDLLVMPYAVRYDALVQMAGLVRHAQGQSLGYDGADKFLPADMTLSNSIGVHEGPTAEMAMTLILASQRGWPTVGRNQAEEKWERAWYPGLIGSRVLLLGVGGIGSEFIKRIAPFDVKLTKVARTARDDVHATSELSQLLPNADIVVIAIPFSEETRGLVNGAFLDLLPRGALVVNVSRGRIIDTDALVERVRTGAIRSALDVVDPEPLPEGHPLWSLPGSLISPHHGGQVSSMQSRVDPLVLHQIERLLAGERPDYVVLPAR
ncbi:MAG TPA: NAD(P)-dependent oxidoreductase [Galbitalea sp.]|nr:NAD(P)-dependent oxidoreductase [Galbitalea sp.]